jgi:hypothetical protein
MATGQQLAQDIDFSSGNLGDGLMSSLFGDNWANLYETGPTSAVGPLLQDIFQLYNLTIAMGAGAIIMYFIWSGALQTAHEGKFLGKRYSSIWSIMRCVLGGAGVVPVFGMSLVQMLVLTFAGLGFQTADQLAVMTAEYLSSGRPLTTFPAFYDERKDKALLAIMQLETCKAYNEQKARIEVPVTWDGNEVQYGASEPLFGYAGDSCGTLSLDTHYYQVVRYAIEDVSVTLREPANAIVAGRRPDMTAIEEARARLKQLDIELTDVARNDVDKETQQAIANFSQSVSIKGWMTLGTWYYTLSEQTARFNQRVSYDFTLNAPDYTSRADMEIDGIAEYIIQGAKFAQDSGVAVSSIEGAEAMQEITNAVFSILEGGGDPYLRLINIGHYAVQASVILVGVKGIAKAVSKLPVGAVAKAAGWISDAGIIGTSVIYILFGAGVLLSCVLLFIPYCIWVFGLCSVFIGVLQSILAAPIWSAAHVIPGGEGITGNYTKQGYMLLISMTARPMMITIGFIFSYFILSGITWIFIEGVKTYIVSGSVDTPGFDYINFFVKLSVSFVLTGIAVSVIAIRSFGFMFEAADKVLAWVGGGEQLGSEDRGGGGRVVGAAVGVVSISRGAGALARGAKAALPQGQGGGKK